MTNWSQIQRHVERRAAGRCEYCRMHQTLQGATFHVEHIVPRSRGGRSELDNLAWACPSCNLHKSDRVEVPSCDSGEMIPLFNPRTDIWEEHFRWDSHCIVGESATGDVTIEVLSLNDERRILIRQAEEMFDLFPPNTGGQIGAR